MKKAFTIVELMLYMAMFSVLVTILGGIFLNIMELQLSTQSNSEVTQSINYVFARLSHDIYSTSSIITPASAGQSGPALTIVINGQNNTYSLSGNNLILTNPNGIFELNSPDVSVTGFSVTRLGTVGKSNVHIGITVQSNVTPLSKSPQIVSYSQSFTLK